MAFATTNVQTATLAGGIKFYAGDWSGSAGDATGSVTLSGGRVYLVAFRSEDTAGPQEDPDATASISAGVITLSVYNHQNVTNGRFLIVYG